MIPFVGKYRKTKEQNRLHTTISQAELDCEEAIIQDRQRFGRTRTTLMRYLRAKYGKSVADRAMWRVCKRLKPNPLYHSSTLQDSAL
jgi:hypothetical protein